MSDRIEDYQRACTEMLERFVHSSEPGGVWHTARACVLAAGATQDPRLPIELTEQVMSGHPVRKTGGFTLKAWPICVPDNLIKQKKFFVNASMRALPGREYSINWG